MSYEFPVAKVITMNRRETRVIKIYGIEMNYILADKFTCLTCGFSTMESSQLSGRGVTKGCRFEQQIPKLGFPSSRI